MRSVVLAFTFGGQAGGFVLRLPPVVLYLAGGFLLPPVVVFTFGEGY